MRRQDLHQGGANKRHEGMIEGLRVCSMGMQEACKAGRYCWLGPTRKRSWGGEGLGTVEGRGCSGKMESPSKRNGVHDRRLPEALCGKCRDQGSVVGGGGGGC